MNDSDDKDDILGGSLMYDRGMKGDDNKTGMSEDVRESQAEKIKDTDAGSVIEEEEISGGAADNAEESEISNTDNSSDLAAGNDKDNDFDEFINMNGVFEDNLDDELFLRDLNRSLSEQVMEELGEDTGDGEGGSDTKEGDSMAGKGKNKNKKKNVLKIVLSVIGVFLLFVVFLIFTKPGQKLVIKIAAWYVHQGMENDGEVIIDPVIILTPTPMAGIEEVTGTPSPTPVPRETIRKEDYVMNFLIFGVEEIDGARNTDSMMLVSINTKDDEIKLASLLRDTYTEVDGHSASKLNAVYAMRSDRAEGAALLIREIEQMCHIDIAGYASVNFSSFESIINMLGGVSIELTAQEAEYLNTTNYISNPEYRNLSEGVNTLNGNQAVGYCRVRKVATLGGAENDYGRTLRQRRVLTAMFNRYKSKNVLELLNISNKCLSYVRTNLSAADIEKALNMVVDNGITSISSTRFPVEGAYYDCGVKAHNGLKYTLVIDDEKLNTVEIFKFIFGDTQEEAEANYELYRNE